MDVNMMSATLPYRIAAVPGGCERLALGDAFPLLSPKRPCPQMGVVAVLPVIVLYRDVIAEDSTAGRLAQLEVERMCDSRPHSHDA